jgi:bifunctional UDP-N-acetylglucosamine pyrophosphorylase/glucosamine-1-phosphate N-acetyltransferase
MGALLSRKFGTCMTDSQLAVIVLAAGQGTRMKSALPKVLHSIGARPMLAHVLATAKALGAVRIVVVTAPNAEPVAALARAWGAESVVQDRQLGTGHAVRAAESALAKFDGNLLVLYGDAPLVTVETLHRLAARAGGSNIAALGFRARDPKGYGRMIVDGDEVVRIVEDKDASAEERRVALCFAGPLVAGARTLFNLLHKLENKNAQGEFYLTDVFTIARKQGLRCAVVEGTEKEMLGVNSRAQLAEAEAAFQARRRSELMDQGVGFVAPDTVYLSADTIIEADATIGPYVVFGPGAKIGSGTQIRAFCHVEGAEVGRGAIIGPFARLRPGAKIEDEVHIGNFVEVKNARIGRGAKANHLAYVGDACVGPAANIGAGAITCNYDGTNKHFTEIGAGVFIGSNATLVAPVKIGDGAYVAAGSTITDNVVADALALGRARQVVKEGKVGTLRARLKTKKKDA